MATHCFIFILMSLKGLHTCKKLHVQHLKPFAAPSALATHLTLTSMLSLCPPANKEDVFQVAIPRFHMVCPPFREPLGRMVNPAGTRTPNNSKVQMNGTDLLRFTQYISIYLKQKSLGSYKTEKDDQDHHSEDSDDDTSAVL